jgi:DNA-binding NtrC family response regulator
VDTDQPGAEYSTERRIEPTSTPSSTKHEPLTVDGGGAAPSLLEIGRRAAMKAEREAIEKVLTQTRWNRRQAAKILKISYKALLNKLKLIEEQDQAKSEQRTA